MRVWFNRAFATTCHIVELIRANPDATAVTVFATHTDPDSPVLAVADHAEAEPADGNYVDWALEFASRHSIDVLVPTRRMAELAAVRADFAAQGVAVACPSLQTVTLFEDKALGYQAAAGLDVPVPPHWVVQDSAGLREAYRACTDLAAQVCMKPVRGVGGEGYRRLTERSAAAAEFAGRVRSTVRVDVVARAWDEIGGAPEPMLVMPYLDGAEVSVDVLADADGAILAAVGRRHDDTRRRRLVDDPAARAVADRLVRAHAISHLSNTQVRYWRGPDDEAERPYLLEVNTRAAGGLFQTALSGVNLPWAMLQVATGQDPGPLQPIFGAEYTSVAATVVLSSRPPVGPPH